MLDLLFEIAKVTGLLMSALRAVEYLKLFYRSVEQCKSKAISNGGSYDDLASLSVDACADLQ